jgi:hypothetical protein
MTTTVIVGVVCFFAGWCVAAWCCAAGAAIWKDNSRAWRANYESIYKSFQSVSKSYDILRDSFDQMCKIADARSEIIAKLHAMLERETPTPESEAAE